MEPRGFNKIFDKQKNSTTALIFSKRKQTPPKGEKIIKATSKKHTLT